MKHIQLSRFLISKVNPSSDIDDESIDELLDKLIPLFEEHGFVFNEHESISLGLDKLSIQRCNECEQLFVNRDLNPAGLDADYVFDNTEYAILDGEEHDGKSLCEECLPTSHRWGHES